MRRRISFALTGVIFAALIASMAESGVADAGNGGADNFLIDMDPSTTPGNTATSVGTIEACAQINQNNVVDADEDAEDAVEIDVVAGPLGIPVSNPMIAFQFTLRYPAGAVTVIAHDQGFLLASGPNSSLLDAGDAVPDSDGEFTSAALDLNNATPGNVPESGPGVLSRFRLQSTPGTLPGVYPLTLGPNSFGGGQPAHVDPNNNGFLPQNLVDTDGDTVPDTVSQVATLAINETCSGEPVPSPSMTPPPASQTPTPGPPTPTPTVSPVDFPPTGGQSPSHSSEWPTVVLGLAAGAAALTAAAVAVRRMRPR